MALSANSVFEVQTGGNDTNGGGFVTGASGTDYSLVAAKRTATGSNDSNTDSVAVGTGVITSVTATFTSAIVGNIIYLQGGTGTLAAGWYQVTVFTSATSITVDRNVAAGTGITMNIGGALASLGMAGGVGLVTGNIIYIKAGTYTISSATPNIAAGCFSSTLSLLIINGYQTTRGDFGTAPVLLASGISTFTLVRNQGADCVTANIESDGANLTASGGFLIDGIGFKLTASNHAGIAFTHTNSISFIRCVARSCSAIPFQTTTGGSLLINCIAHDNTSIGFIINSYCSAFYCISDSNSGASSDGFSIYGGANSQVVNCVSYASGRDGFRIEDDAKLIQNCISEANAGFGINNVNRSSILMINNATFNNTSGGVNVGTGVGNISFNPVTGSASFFVDAPNQNFALNNTAGAGAAARAAGYPGVLPVGGTGFLDIGALQHADPISSGGMNIFAGEGIGSVISG